MVPPVIRLNLNIGKIPERSQGPEVVPDVVNGSLFHLALLMGLRHIAGYRDNCKGHEKGKECLVEANQRPLSFYDRGEHVIVNQLPWGPVEKPKGIEQATVQCLLSL